jgi:bacteriocin-like protein
MTKQTKLMLVEELSENELEAISGGRATLIDASNLSVDVRDINVVVAAQALTSRSLQKVIVD